MSHVVVVRRDHEELEHNKKLLGYQGRQILGLVLTAFGVWVVEFFWPHFFNYPYFKWSFGDGALFHFWPLFVYSAVLAVLLSKISGIQSSRLDEKILGYNIATSVLAGVWEEIGYRCLYICTAMVGLVFLNFLYSTIFGVVIGGICFVVAVVRLKDKHFISGLIALVLGILTLWLWTKIDPLYGLYSVVIIPCLNFFSMGFLGPILYNGHEELFVMGAIAANASFRDGHKYQGPIGYVNAWIVGFVCLYAALTYGLLVAIMIHALYDIEVGFVRYFCRKMESDD